MIHEALHHAHHFTFAAMLFRNFRHGSMSILALKRLYAAHGMLDGEDADLPLVKVDTMEEMCQLLSGPTTLHVGQYDPEIFEESEKKGDFSL